MIPEIESENLPEWRPEIDIRRDSAEIWISLARDNDSYICPPINGTDGAIFAIKSFFV